MNYDETPEYRDWEHRVRTDLIPKLEQSAVVASLVPTGETDIKFAVELGLSIMMDKPIIAIIEPGVRMPERLARVVDHIVEADLHTEAGRERLQQTMHDLLTEN